MKKLIVLFLLIPSLLFAGNVQKMHSAVLQKAIGGGSCSVSVTFAPSGTKGATTFGHYANRFYGGGVYTTSAAMSVCQVDIRLSLDAGDVSGKTYYVAIYTMSGTAMGTLQGASTGVTGSNSWSETDVSFSFASSVSLSDATDYAFVVYPDSVDYDNKVELSTITTDTNGMADVKLWEDNKTLKATYATDMFLVIYED